jgi:hypothetical protein
MKKNVSDSENSVMDSINEHLRQSADSLSEFEASISEEPFSSINSSNRNAPNGKKTNNLVDSVNKFIEEMKNKLKEKT